MFPLISRAFRTQRKQISRHSFNTRSAMPAGSFLPSPIYPPRPISLEEAKVSGFEVLGRVVCDLKRI